MSVSHRSRRERRGIAGASRRAGLLAILSALLLLIGQFVASADPPDGSGDNGNGAEVSQEHGSNSSFDEASATNQEETTSEDDSTTVQASDEEQAEVESDAEEEATVTAGGRASEEASADEDGSAEVRVQGGGGGTAKITICHRTNAPNNAYVQITVSVSAADGIAGNSGPADHFGEHQGPLVTSVQEAENLKAQGIMWGDIIPNVDDEGNPMPHNGLNWTAQGQAIWQAGCEFAAPPPQAANFSIVKSGPANATVGGTFSYTVTVTNTGNATATNVTVTDNVSGALTVTGVTFAFANPTATGGTCPTQQNVSCNVGSLLAGQSVTVTIAVTVTANACPQVQNTASVSATGISIRSSNTVTTTVPCPPNVPSLSLSKTGTATVAQGGTITYTVTVTNSGTGAASNVVITDDLDNSLTGVTASSTIGTCSVGANNVVTCNVGTLAASGQAGSSATITITATAPTGSCPTITNQATGTHAGGTIPSSGTVTTTVTGCGGPGPAPEVTVNIEKTNDANADGVFTNNEEALRDGLAVDFKVVITNTSDVEVQITDLTDAFEQTTLDLLDAECPALDGMTLDAGESVTCIFTLPNYSPAQGTAIIDIAEVCVRIVGGVETACDTNPSRVRSAIVLGRTITPTPTGPPAPPPTRTPPGGIAFTGPGAAMPLAAAALALLTLGTGLLWVGRRRRHAD